MQNLIENILNEDYVSAKEIFESRLDEIMAQKIYEMKRMIAANMDESVGGLTKAEIEARKKAGYRKASDVLGDPREKKSEKLNPGAKLIKKKVSEAVDVKPDPEGRVRGGEAKAGKENPLMRKITAKIIKVGRKVGGKEFRKSYLAGKEAGNQEAERETKSEPKAKRKAAPEPKTDEKPSKSWLKRNINTFKGREPDEDAPPRKGGSVGRVLRAGLKGAESGLHNI